MKTATRFGFILNAGFCRAKKAQRNTSNNVEHDIRETRLIPLVRQNNRIWIVFLLLVTHSLASTTILSQGARNVKNAASYGGVSAVGDGTDDTQAFLDALNIGRNNPLAENGCFQPVAIYVPPGTYKVSKTLIIWENTFLFGEPSAPPTIVMEANSPNFASGANPFIVTASGYNMQPYSTDWSDRGGSYSTTNNIFFVDVHDINFTVSAGNPGCSDVFLFAMAQQGSLRNSVLTATASQLDVLRTDLGGGGGILQNVTCSGSPTAVQINDTSQIVFRGCTLNGPVRDIGGQMVNFVACTFNDPGNVGFFWTGGYWFGMDDCTFTANTPFSPGSAHYHIENSDGVAQFTSNNAYYNGTSMSGSSGPINASAKGSLYANPAFPHPTTACVNVQTFGAKGDGGTDDTAAIKSAYASSNEVFFPIGTYVVSGTITLGPNQKMFGQGISYCPAGSAPPTPKSGTVIYETTAVPALSVTGRGTGGVVITDIQIYQAAASTCVVWNGDQSSIVADCHITTGLNANSPMIQFQSGGGFFENGWWPNDFNLPVGLQIQSTDPLYLYSIQTEHYGATADVFNGASNVFVLNLENEFSPAYEAITNSSNIFIQGVLAGNQSGGPGFEISNSNSTVNVFGGLMQENSQGILEENGTVYGPTSNSASYAVLDGYMRATAMPNPTPTPRPIVVYGCNYDAGGQGIGYEDTQGCNSGIYRTDGEDIKASSDTGSPGTGYVLGWRAAGEWTNYTVNVAEADQYTVTARIESAFNTGAFHVNVDGVARIPLTGVPLTGAWIPLHPGRL